MWFLILLFASVFVSNPRALTCRERRFLKLKLSVFCLSSVNRFIVLPFVVIIGFRFTERFQRACCMDRQTLRWLAFSFGVDAADADQARINGMSKGFVFSAFVVLFFGCLFIFLSSRVVFDFIVCIGFYFFT